MDLIGPEALAVARVTNPCYHLPNLCDEQQTTPHLGYVSHTTYGVTPNSVIAAS